MLIKVVVCLLLFVDVNPNSAYFGTIGLVGEGSQLFKKPLASERRYRIFVARAKLDNEVVMYTFIFDFMKSSLADAGGVSDCFAGPRHANLDRLPYFAPVANVNRLVAYLIE